LTREVPSGLTQYPVLGQTDPVAVTVTDRPFLRMSPVFKPGSSVVDATVYSEVVTPPPALLCDARASTIVATTARHFKIFM
jgi:hypothetical protein